MSENNRADHVGLRKPDVNAARIDGLRSSFEAFRSESRDRLRQIQYTLIGMFSTLVITLLSLAVTFLSSI